MEEDNNRISSSTTQEERIKLIKEQRRRLHEERLKQIFNTTPTPNIKSSGDITDVRPISGSASSLDQPTTTTVLKKPTIPHILRSSTEPVTRAYIDQHQDSSSLKKPSILKKKDDPSCSGGISTKDSCSSSNNPATVSFGLSVTKLLTRTKSIDSNLSGDTETGYWSGGENSCGILLKSRRNTLDDDGSDQSLKLRRSSLGSSIVSSGSEGGLQSILKRKLSYDSSLIMKESTPGDYSFSTHSLPSACGCLSPEPKKPILKKKSSSEDLEEMEPKKPILKHRNFRDNEFSLDNERIKPCLKNSLKKSSSKSADECYPPSYSPIFNDSLSQHSSTNKGILKKGGILKNTWRESSSTSNSSSSSDFHNDDPSDNLRCGRYFCSESNLDSTNASSENNNLDFPPLNTSDADASLGYYPDSDRYDALNVENGLASNNQIGRLLVTSTESAKNSSTTTSSHHGKVDCENNQIEKKTLPLNTLPLPEKDKPEKKTTEEDCPQPFRLNWRRNSLGTPSQLHDLDYEISSQTQGNQNLNTTQAERLLNMGSKVERTDSHEDIVMSLTVAEKRSLFMQLENECLRKESIFTRRNAEKLKGASRVRYTTQPVTTDEVEKAMMVLHHPDHENHGSAIKEKSTTTTKKIPFVQPTNHEVLEPSSSSAFKETTSLKRCNYLPLSQSLDSGDLISDHRSEDRLQIDTSLTRISKGELHDEGVHFPVTSKPPSGAAYNTRRSFTTPRESSSFIVPTESTQLNGHWRNDGPNSESSILNMTESANIKDRIKMFNVLASSECQRLSTKRPVTSKRFATQPVKSSPLQLEEWRSGASRIIVATDSTDGASSSIMRKETNVPTTPSGKDNKSTVRDEEGQIGESECSKSLNAISGSSSESSDDSSSTNVVNSCQDFISETSPKRSTAMPEKILPFSEDLSISSADHNEVPTDPDRGQDFDHITSSDEFSRNKTRKLSKSSSATSMMMSPESDLNLFREKNVNRTSIAEKIAALQTNGEITWKTRVSKIGKIVPTDQNDNLEAKKNNKDSSVIASKLSQLSVSQEGWKKRIGGENDASLFTVEGRLEKAGKIVRNVEPEAPTSPNKSFKLRFQNRTAEALESPKSLVDDPSSESDSVKTPVKTSKQFFRPPDVTSSSETSEEEKVLRRVFQNDNDTFQNFFSDPLSVLNKTTTTTPQVQINDFTAIQLENRKFLGLRKDVKVPRNHAHITNPVKSLAARSLDQTYMELNPEVREKKEIKRRILMESYTSSDPKIVFKKEALAGLASKVDFSSVQLKKAAGNQTNNKGYPHPMLICIKGKSKVQTRLVCPETQSISSGNNYILVTADKLYSYTGEYSNRLERAKLADVVNCLSSKRHLGITSRPEVLTIEEPLVCASRDRVNKFFKLLGSEKPPEQNSKSNDVNEFINEEAYENAVISTNRLYAIDESREELVALTTESGWGSQPRYSILVDDKVLVFDFGSEMYVWSGSKADSFLKKTGFRLAKKLFANPYNVTDTGIDAAFSPMKSLLVNQRPTWCLLEKINQHMEPITFSEKFFDWPDDSGRLIKVQQKKVSDVSKEIGYNFKPSNVDEMLAQFNNVPDPTLEVEGFNVGRGCSVKEDCHDYIISTLGIKAWTISEFSKCDLDLLGHFYSQETYVIRWQLSVTQIGRDLKGNKSKHSGKVLGRERCVYFFWQGKDSKITEQGTSALMTVELDQEKGPQIRVEQGREHPAFLSLFKGLMMIHLGLKESSGKDVKLYIAMGACLTEGHFIEVAPEASSFRSLGSFILVDFVKQRVYLWNGSLSNDVTRKIASNGAAKFVESPKIYLNSERQFKLIELEEGDENQAFLACFRPVPNSLIWSESHVNLSGRTLQNYANVDVFTFSSLSGTFEAAPVFSPKRKSDSPEAFPLLQDQIYYYHQQPKLFLINRGPETWLWQGWRPRGDDENDNTSTGSGELRWAAERKAALETAVEISRKKGTKGYLVFAGLEPPSFTNIFPDWSVDEEAREVNLAEGRAPNSTIAVEEALEKFLKTTYTLAELQMRPEGVDHSRLETYLDHEDFESVMKMSKEEFVKLPAWKKNELKKAVGLF